VLKGNEDGEGIREIVDMLGTMVLTTYAVLAEHSLLKPDSPDNKIRNIGIVSLLMFQFLGIAEDVEPGWGCEVVRLLDEAGVKLEDYVRKQVPVTKEEIADARTAYKKKMEASDYGQDDMCNGNGYLAFERMQDWTPKNDLNGEEERMWYRWDWVTEVRSGKRCDKIG